MAVYNVFSHCVTYQYKSTICSKSTIFLIVTTFLTFFLPLLVAYRSHGFWVKMATYREQPKVHFKQHYILLLETNRPDKPVMCSSFPNLNEMTKDFNYCTLVKTREEDNNYDGVADELFFEINAVMPVSLNVHAIQLFMVFSYTLHTVCLMQMESLAVFQHSSNFPGARVDVVADLRLVQKQLLYSRGRDLRYNSSIFDSNTLSPESFHSAEILRNYGKRNLSTNLQNMYVTWSRGPVIDDAFVVSFHIQYPEETVMYRPGFWQVMKWAWIQYLSMLIIFMVLFRYVKFYVFRNRLVPTVQEIPWKKMF